MSHYFIHCTLHPNPSHTEIDFYFLRRPVGLLQKNKCIHEVKMCQPQSVFRLIVSDMLVLVYQTECGQCLHQFKNIVVLLKRAAVQLSLLHVHEAHYHILATSFVSIWIVTRIGVQCHWNWCVPLCIYHRKRPWRTLTSAALCVICGRGVSIPHNTRVWQNDHCTTTLVL